MTQIETTASAAAAPKHIPIKDVVLRVGLSRATIYRRVDSGEFPTPVRLSANRVAWRICEIEAWENEIAEARVQ